MWVLGKEPRFFTRVASVPRHLSHLPPLYPPNKVQTLLIFRDVIQLWFAASYDHEESISETGL